MSSISTIILFVISVVTSVWFAAVLMRFFSQRQQYSLPVRGIFKKYAYDEITPEARPLVKQLFTGVLVFSIAPIIWVVIFTWGTDYSFLIGLFPLVWFYYLNKYLMWEKHDFETEKKSKKD